MKKILIMLGSRREHSFNAAVADFIVQNLAGKAETETADYFSLPFFNQDLEFPVPETVQTLRDQLAENDALWIITPEYNGSIPGGLKNALDWISRPIRKGEFGPPVFVKGKPAAITSAGSRGGARVRAELSGLLGRMQMQTQAESLGIDLPRESFATGNFTLSSEQEQALLRQIEAFLSFIA